MARIYVVGDFRGREVSVAWEDGRVERPRFLKEEMQEAHAELLEAAALGGPGRIGPETFRERVLKVLENPEFLEDSFSAESEVNWRKQWHGFARREYLIATAKHLGFTLAVLVAIDVTLQVGGLWRVITWVGVLLFFGYVAIITIASDFDYEWTPWIERWQPKYERRPLATWVLAFVELTAIFGVLTALLYEQHVFAGNVTYASHLVLVFSGYYLWHFLDAIPALSVPETLNWRVPATLTGFDSGAMLLLYKLLVIVPVVGAVRALLARRTS